jgi:hypothetical protein
MERILLVLKGMYLHCSIVTVSIYQVKRVKIWYMRTSPPEFEVHIDRPSIHLQDRNHRIRIH